MLSVKTGERRDIDVINGKFKWKKKQNKRATVTISFKGANRAVAGEKKGELWFCDIFFRERETSL